MALTMIQLVLCSMLALTATCQRLTNGNLSVVKALKKLETITHAVKKTTIVHYDIKNLKLIAVLKKHERVWMISFNYFKKKDFELLKYGTVSYEIDYK